jgi:hypothetical protein
VSAQGFVALVEYIFLPFCEPHLPDLQADARSNLNFASAVVLCFGQERVRTAVALNRGALATWVATAVMEFEQWVRWDDEMLSTRRHLDPPPTPSHAQLTMIPRPPSPPLSTAVITAVDSRLATHAPAVFDAAGAVAREMAASALRAGQETARMEGHLAGEASAAAVMYAAAPALRGEAMAGARSALHAAAPHLAAQAAAAGEASAAAVMYAAAPALRGEALAGAHSALHAAAPHLAAQAAAAGAEAAAGAVNAFVPAITHHASAAGAAQAAASEERILRLLDARFSAALASIQAMAEAAAAASTAALQKATALERVATSIQQAATSPSPPSPPAHLGGVTHAARRRHAAPPPPPPPAPSQAPASVSGGPTRSRSRASSRPPSDDDLTTSTDDAFEEAVAERLRQPPRATLGNRPMPSIHSVEFLLRGASCMADWASARVGRDELIDHAFRSLWTSEVTARLAGKEREQSISALDKVLAALRAGVRDPELLRAIGMDAQYVVLASQYGSRRAAGVIRSFHADCIPRDLRRRLQVQALLEGGPAAADSDAARALGADIPSSRDVANRRLQTSTAPAARQRQRTGNGGRGGGADAPSPSPAIIAPTTRAAAARGGGGRRRSGRGGHPS